MGRGNVKSLVGSASSRPASPDAFASASLCAIVRHACAVCATKFAIPCWTWSDSHMSRSSRPASTAASRSNLFLSRAAAERCSAFGSALATVSGTSVRRMEGRDFGWASSSALLDGVDVPRLRESQSFTQSGTGAGVNVADLSARIHMRASECLHRNFLLGQVHL